VASNRQRAWRFVLAAVLLSIAFAAPDSTASTGEYLIVENPRALRIRDRYEQMLSKGALKALPAYMPFKVVERHALLGDQITQATRVEYANSEYYLVEDDRGNLRGKSDAGYMRAFKAARPRGDTIEIVRTDAIRLYPRYPAGGQPVSLNAGKRIERVFSLQGRHYLRTLGSSPSCGWSTLSPSSAWRIPEKTPVATAELDNQLQGRIQERINRANDVYATYFRHFNERTGQSLPAPAWRCAVTDHGMECEPAAASPAQAVPVSTRQLVDDLDQLLLASPYTARLRGGKIVITQKERLAY
jgi:hypothetical protein